MRKICELCDKPVKGQGFCSTHYQRFLRHGNADYCPRTDCGFENCVVKVNPNKGKLCAKHSALKQNRAYRKRNPEWVAAHELRRTARRLGLDPATVSKSFREHNRCCDICGTKIPDKRSNRMHLDHDHATGSFRGWLCGNCNTGIGRFKDNPELLRKAAAYLELVVPN
jgi:hypothetical protein